MKQIFILRHVVRSGICLRSPCSPTFHLPKSTLNASPPSQADPEPFNPPGHREPKNVTKVRQFHLHFTTYVKRGSYHWTDINQFDRHQVNKRDAESATPPSRQQNRRPGYELLPTNLAQPPSAVPSPTFESTANVL